MEIVDSYGKKVTRNEIPFALDENGKAVHYGQWSIMINASFYADGNISQVKFIIRRNGRIFKEYLNERTAIATFLTFGDRDEKYLSNVSA